MTEKARGAARTVRNKETYAAEVARMHACGEKFPVNQFGTVSVGAFAKKIGVSVKVLTEGALKDQFESDVEIIGLTSHQPSSSKLKEKADGKTKEAGELAKKLRIKIKEVEGLQSQVEKLERQVRQLQLGRQEKEKSLEHLLATGERFFL